MKPSLGRVIITKGVVNSTGTDEAPAIITRVWSDKEPAEAVVLVNATVFPDLASPRPQGSIQLFETRAEAEAEQAKVNAIGDNEENFKKRGLSGPMVAFWPDRA